MGGGTGQRGPGRRQRTAGGAGQTEPGEVRQKGETRRATVEGHPRHAGPGEARPGVPGASGVHPEGDREPQRRWGACWMRLGGGRLKGSWSVESLQLSSQGCAPCAFTARPPAPTG